MSGGRTLRVTGHDGLSAGVVFGPEAGQPTAVELLITDRTVMREFRRLIARALNTMESPPAWAMDLADALEHVK